MWFPDIANVYVQMARLFRLTSQIRRLPQLNVQNQSIPSRIGRRTRDQGSGAVKPVPKQFCIIGAGAKKVDACSGKQFRSLVSM